MMTLGVNSLIVPAEVVVEEVVVVVALWADARPAVAKRAARTAALMDFFVIFFMFRKLRDSIGKCNGVYTPYRWAVSHVAWIKQEPATGIKP